MTFLYPVMSLVYAATFHYSYVEFINPTFEYADLYYFQPTSFGLVLTYALVMLPVLYYRSRRTVASYGAELIYVVCYTPAQLVFLFNWRGDEGELALVQIALAISMKCILGVSALGEHLRRDDGVDEKVSHDLGRFTILTIHLVTAASVVMLIATHGDSMRFVGLDDIYEQRLASNQAERGIISNYLSAFLTSAFLPFYYARGVMRKALGDIGIGIAISLLVYMATAAKAAILMGPLIWALYFLFGNGSAFLLRLLGVCTAAIVVAMLLPQDDDLSFFIRSLLLVRVLGIGGWAMTLYYEFFSTYGFTYYTHIGPINALTSAYPYGALTLGEAVGLQYSGSEEANFNANFWASDGFAAMGIWGLPIVTSALCGVMLMMNRFSQGMDKRFVFLWLWGFWQALLNVPLTTALLSGGGLLVIAFIRLDALVRQSPTTGSASTGEASTR